MKCGGTNMKYSFEEMDKNLDELLENVKSFNELSDALKIIKNTILELQNEMSEIVLEKKNINEIDKKNTERFKDIQEQINMTLETHYKELIQMNKLVTDETKQLASKSELTTIESNLISHIKDLEVSLHAKISTQQFLTTKYKNSIITIIIISTIVSLIFFLFFK